MKDRYLYKAKRKGNEEWVTGQYVKGLDMYDKEVHLIFEPTTIFYSSGETDGWSEIEPSTVCQCTGLKDKNGKLIWENDIIKTFDAGEEWCLSKIIFADTSLGCGWKTTDIKSLSKYNNNLFKEVSFGSFDSKSVEVIGNIFDNAELLESEG